MTQKLTRKEIGILIRYFDIGVTADSYLGRTSTKEGRTANKIKSIRDKLYKMKDELKDD